MEKKFEGGKVGEPKIILPEWKGRFRDLCMEVFTNLNKEIAKKEGESEREYITRKAEIKLQLRGLAGELTDMLGLDLNKETLNKIKVALLKSLAASSSASEEDSALDRSKAQVVTNDLYQLTGLGRK